MFQVTSHFRAAAELLEKKIPAEKLPKFLGKILLHAIGSGEKRLFTDEQAAQACAALSLLASELKTIVEACRYVFEKAMYNNANGEALSSFLADSAGMGKSHADAFAGAWESGSIREEMLKRNQNYTIGCPLVLSSVDWELRMNLAQSRIRERKDCVVDMSLGLSAPDGSGDASEAFTVEFSHDELSEFFTKVECIQKQLDAMT